MIDIDADTSRRNLQRQRNIFSVSVTLLAILALFSHARFRVFGIHAGDIGLVALVILLLLLLVGEPYLRRRSRQAVNADATARMRQLVPSQNGQVRIDDWAGEKQIDWYREGADVVITGRALRDFTPEELDFVLASTAGPTDTNPTENLILRASIMTVGLIGAAFFVYAFRHMHMPVPIAAICYVLILGGSAVLSLNKEQAAKSQAVERATEADDAALKITGDRDAAESALSKAAEQAVIKKDWEARLRNIRYAEFRSMASTLPPRGWKPS